MEDQIYRLLRSSRVITNNSSESLFAVPTRGLLEDFIYASCIIDLLFRKLRLHAKRG